MDGTGCRACFPEKKIERPGSDLFVVYNEDRDTAGASSFPKRRELIVKLTFYAVTF